MRTPDWIGRISDISTAISSLNSDVIGRSRFEVLFGLKRRQAVELMNRFGAKMTGVGGGLVIQRNDLLEALQKAAQTPEAQAEIGRRLKVLETLKGNRVKKMVDPKIVFTTLATLPAGVLLNGPAQPGGEKTLTITYTTQFDLLEKLFALSQAWRNYNLPIEGSPCLGAGVKEQVVQEEVPVRVQMFLHDQPVEELAVVD
jgi:hypothetical protein